MTASPPVAIATATPPQAAPAATSSGRIRSVDAVRGLVVASAVLVTAVPGTDRPALLEHAGWTGLTALDLIFPAFLTLFGVGIAVSTRRRVRWGRLARRTVVLLLVGWAFNVVAAWRFDAAAVRLTGVLPLFAVVGLAVVLATRVLRAWWAALAAAAAVWAGYALLLASYAGGCPDRLLTPACNPTGRATTVLVGAAHSYQSARYGFDPEGPLSVLSACGTVLVGYAAGRLLLARRGLPTSAALLAVGAGTALAALPLVTLAPVAKRMWTPPFAALTAGLTVVVLAVAAAVIDRPGRSRRPGTWLLESFGRNSLLVYFGKGFVAALVAHVVVAGSPLGEWLVARLPDLGAGAGWTYAGLVLVAWALLATLLHHRRLYLRA